MDIPYIPGDYCVGCVVVVPVSTEVGVVQHKGILGDRFGDDGCPTVLHSAKLYGCIVESSMSEFCMKALGPVRSEGYPGVFPPEVVIMRARSQIEEPWKLWHNCEHFVSWAHGIKVSSPQLRTAAKKSALVGGLIGLGILLAR